MPTVANAGPRACECTDPGCPHHPAVIYCMEEASQRLWRIDMEDATGVAMCHDCATDALEAGVFTPEAPWDPWNEADWQHEREREER